MMTRRATLEAAAAFSAALVLCGPGRAAARAKAPPLKKLYILLVVDTVSNLGPAERHGFEAGDRIVAIGGQPVRGPDQCAMLLDGSGGWVKITVIDVRTRKIFDCSVRLKPIR